MPLLFPLFQFTLRFPWPKVVLGPSRGTGLSLSTLTIFNNDDDDDNDKDREKAESI